jgi:hypothetical protein
MREVSMTGNLVSQLNAALRKAGLPREAVYVPAPDGMVDDDIELRVAGQPTRFTIQLAEFGHIARLNEHGFDHGLLAWFRTVAEIPVRNVAAVCRRVMTALQS